jgi:16S rRNA (guanine(527)-N(7))-methyltransferase RsmG
MIKEKPFEKIWANFQENYNLTNEQLEQFKKYQGLLSDWNKNINLTAITDLAGIIRQHFEDSLALKQFIDLNTIKSIADIGTGAGFPAIPLKIFYPHLKVFLIEVNNKKQKFLLALIDYLKLKNVEIIDLDWRTFLRTTKEQIDLFVTRAAIDETELCRMFKPGCFYKNSQLAYWTTQEWESNPKFKKFLIDQKEYNLGNKHRKLAFMRLEKQS